MGCPCFHHWGGKMVFFFRVWNLLHYLYRLPMVGGLLTHGTSAA